MRIQSLKIDKIPALLLGDDAEKVFLYVHGKMGSKEEALPFARAAEKAGWQVVAIDLPEHGERKDAPEKLLPWVTVPEIRLAYEYLHQRWKCIALYGISIGAWLSMQALADAKLDRALLVSPVVDMEELIGNMMRGAKVTEEQLRQAGVIPTDFGETLSWQYLCWVREHPLRWKNRGTQVLYGTKDNMTSRLALERFKQASGAHLTILQEGEHWFHTELQLYVLRAWEEKWLRTTQS